MSVVCSALAFSSGWRELIQYPASWKHWVPSFPVFSSRSCCCLQKFPPYSPAQHSGEDGRWRTLGAFLGFSEVHITLWFSQLSAPFLWSRRIVRFWLYFPFLTSSEDFCKHLLNAIYQGGLSSAPFPLVARRKFSSRYMDIQFSSTPAYGS